MPKPPERGLPPELSGRSTFEAIPKPIKAETAPKIESAMDAEIRIKNGIKEIENIFDEAVKNNDVDGQINAIDKLMAKIRELKSVIKDEQRLKDLESKFLELNDARTSLIEALEKKLLE